MHITSIAATDPLNEIVERLNGLQPLLLQGYPSVIRRLAGGSGVLEFETKDALSPILEAEYSVDAKEWVRLEPTDGISDSMTETYRIKLDPKWKGAFLLVRVSDAGRNVASASFTPPDNGSYGVSLIVSDRDGGSASLPRGVPAPAGLVSWWRGEGDANDSRDGNHGALVGGVTFAAGRVGQAFNLNGSNRVEVADAPNLDLTSAVTLEAWINPSSLAFTNNFGTIVAKNV